MLTEEQKIERKLEYRWYKEHGICVVCHKRDAFHRYVRCEICHEKSTLLQKERRLKPEHRQKINDMRRERRANGLCEWCGKPVCKESKTYCLEHYIRKNKLRKEWRRKRNEENRAKGYYKNKYGKIVKYLTEEEKLAIRRENIRKARLAPAYREQLEKRKKYEHELLMVAVAKKEAEHAAN